MDDSIHTIENDVQDRNSLAWHTLCAYVDKIARDESEEFSPVEEMGYELFSQIHTLPESIAQLKKVKKIWLYGSKLKRIPPEIGQMESLEYFDPYTSHQLHWYPYEIVNCKKLTDSRVSTRILFGNFKNRLPFPSLAENPVRYHGETLRCSICAKKMTYQQTNQLWISLYIGTDTLPLLANLCSTACEQELPQPELGYVPYPHKGGPDLKQPTREEWQQMMRQKREQQAPTIQANNTPPKAPKLLKLIKKIWD
jgi:hypothetical protein